MGISNELSTVHVRHHSNRLADSRFLEAAIRSGFRWMKEDNWLTPTRSLADLPGHLDLDVDWYEKNVHSEVMIVSGKAGVVRVALGQDRVNVEALSDEAGACPLMNRVQAYMPKAMSNNSAPVKFWFWNEARSMAASRQRMLEVPQWEEIAGNYTRRVSDEVERLVAHFEPSKGGQLILWHGDPGTGKTHALKSLARGWSAWCSFEYVTDPERFFGNASYLIHVMLEEPARDREWRVLILEDTGELIRPDARSEMGQGLSRLLNVVDGMIGQGLKTLLLATTNEPLQRLHPAVSRPGRCASLVEFTPFTESEALRWLERHGISVNGGRIPRRLADLYAARESFSHQGEAAEEGIGFRVQKETVVRRRGSNSQGS